MFAELSNFYSDPEFYPEFSKKWADHRVPLGIHGDDW